MALDPSEYTVDELEEELAEMEDRDEVEAALQAEEHGEDRKGAKEAIEARLEELSPLERPTWDKQFLREKGGHYEDMWVYCETQAGELIDVSKEMVGKARELMDGYNEEYDEDENVVAVLIGNDIEKHAEDIKKKDPSDRSVKTCRPTTPTPIPPERPTRFTTRTRAKCFVRTLTSAKKSAALFGRTTDETFRTC